jgi:hypothetical protein
MNTNFDLVGVIWPKPVQKKSEALDIITHAPD